MSAAELSRTEALDEVPASTPPKNETKPKRSPLKSPMVRVILVAVGIGVLIFAGSWSWSWWTVGRFEESTNNAYLRADATVVAPKVAGYVSRVLVSANQSVVAGQPIVEIDRRPFEAALARAEADVAAREADLARTRAEARRQDAVIAQSDAQARVEDRAEALADTEARRSVRLAAIGADTTQRRDEAVAARDQSRARVAAAATGVVIARRQSEVLATQLRQNEAALAAARAGVRDAELNLEATTVRAGAAGRIGDKTVTPGQYVQAGTRLMTIMPVERVYLDANFKETQIGHMRVGQPVRVRIDALPDRVIPGRVESFSPGTGAQFALLPPDNTTGNFTKIVQRVTVRVRLEPPEEVRAALLPGLSAEIAVNTRGVAR